MAIQFIFGNIYFLKISNLFPICTEVYNLCRFYSGTTVLLLQTPEKCIITSSRSWKCNYIFFIYNYYVNLQTNMPYNYYVNLQKI